MLSKSATAERLNKQMRYAYFSMKNTCYETFNRYTVVKENLTHITGLHPALFKFNRSAVQNNDRMINNPLYSGAMHSHIYIRETQSRHWRDVS
jgi:hypothetical protein